MKHIRIITIVALAELVLLGYLIKRLAKQEERLVAASAAIVVQQEQLHLLRLQLYGEAYTFYQDFGVLASIRELHSEPNQDIQRRHWNEWMRVYAYGPKKADGTPDSYSANGLFMLDLAALQNYLIWVGEADLARKTSKSSFWFVYNSYLKAVGLEGKSDRLVPVPVEKFGSAREFSLPQQ